MKKKLLLILFIFLAGCSLTNNQKKESNSRIELINDGSNQEEETKKEDEKSDKTETKKDYTFEEIIETMRELESYFVKNHVHLVHGDVGGEIVADYYVNLPSRKSIIDFKSVTGDFSKLFIVNEDNYYSFVEASPILQTWDDEYVTIDFSYRGDRVNFKYKFEDDAIQGVIKKHNDRIFELENDIQYCSFIIDEICKYDVEIDKNYEMSEATRNFIFSMDANRVIRAIQTNNGYVIKVVTAYLKDDKVAFQLIEEYDKFNQVNINDIN